MIHEIFGKVGKCILFFWKEFLWKEFFESENWSLTNYKNRKHIIVFRKHVELYAYQTGQMESNYQDFFLCYPVVKSISKYLVYKNMLACYGNKELNCFFSFKL